LSEANVEVRLEGYREALASIADKPLLGYGVGHYDISRPDSFLSVHNAFLEQWKYFGIIFGTVTVACYVAIMAYFLSVRRRLNEWSRFTDALGCAWLCLLVISLVGTFFEATTPRAITYFLLGLCVSVCNRQIAVEGRSDVRTP